MTKTFPPHGKPADKLNARHIEFCEEYVANKHNGTQAYMVVYKNKNAKASGVGAAKLLKMPKVQKRIASIEARISELVLRREAERNQEIENRQIDVIRGLMQIAYTPLTAVAEWDADGMSVKPSAQLNEAEAMSLKSIKVKKTVVAGNEDRGEITTTEIQLTQHDKIKAMELLGQNKGMFTYTVPMEKPYAVLIPERREPGKPVLTKQEKRNAKDV